MTSSAVKSLSRGMMMSQVLPASVGDAESTAFISSRACSFRV